MHIHSETIKVHIPYIPLAMCTWTQKYFSTSLAKTCDYKLLGAKTLRTKLTQDATMFTSRLLLK